MDIACCFLVVSSCSCSDGNPYLQLCCGVFLVRLRLLTEHRKVALLLEAFYRVVQGLAHRPELEPEVLELLVGHLVWLLPRVCLVRAPVARITQDQ